jgi:SOS response regulatory protein OraA/RecX
MFKRKIVIFLFVVALTLGISGCAKQVKSVSLDKATLTVEHGGNFVLTATVMPDDASDKSVKWVVNTEYLSATTSENTLQKEFLAAKVGQTTIGVTSKKGESASCVVTITENADDKAAREKADAELEVMEEKTAALSEANSYLSHSYFSKAGLFDQLSSKAGSGFSEEAAQYAIDNVKVDWKEMALGQANSYLKTSSYSKQGLYRQLTSKAGSKFLPEEGQYAIDNVKADWKEMALEKAKSYLRSSDMSTDSLRRQLKYENFTDDEINYAINHLNN